MHNLPLWEGLGTGETALSVTAFGGASSPTGGAKGRGTIGHGRRCRGGLWPPGDTTQHRGDGIPQSRLAPCQLPLTREPRDGGDGGPLGTAAPTGDYGRRCRGGCSHPPDDDGRSAGGPPHPAPMGPPSPLSGEGIKNRPGVGAVELGQTDSLCGRGPYSRSMAARVTTHCFPYFCASRPGTSLR